MFEWNNYLSRFQPPTAKPTAEAKHKKTWSPSWCDVMQTEKRPHTRRKKVLIKQRTKNEHWKSFKHFVRRPFCPVQRIFNDYIRHLYSYKCILYIYREEEKKNSSSHFAALVLLYCRHSPIQYDERTWMMPLLCSGATDQCKRRGIILQCKCTIAIAVVYPLLLCRIKWKCERLLTRTHQLTHTQTHTKGECEAR